MSVSVDNHQKNRSSVAGNASFRSWEEDGAKLVGKVQKNFSPIETKACLELQKDSTAHNLLKTSDTSLSIPGKTVFHSVFIVTSVVIVWNSPEKPIIDSGVHN